MSSSLRERLKRISRYGSPGHQHSDQQAKHQTVENAHNLFGSAHGISPSSISTNTAEGPRDNKSANHTPIKEITAATNSQKENTNSTANSSSNDVDKDPQHLDTVQKACGLYEPCSIQEVESMSEDELRVLKLSLENKLKAKVEVLRKLKMARLYREKVN